MATEKKEEKEETETPEEKSTAPAVDLDELAKKMVAIMRPAEGQAPSGEKPPTLREIEEITEAKVKAAMKSLSTELKTLTAEKAGEKKEGEKTPDPIKRTPFLRKLLWGDDDE